MFWNKEMERLEGSKPLKRFGGEASGRGGASLKRGVNKRGAGSGSAILWALLICLFWRGNSEGAEDLRLWYREPATNWLQALPVGNGKLAGMVFGGVAAERVQLNEGSLWSGRAHDTDNPGASGQLAEVRKLIFAGNFTEAERVAGQSLAGKGALSEYGAPETLGDLFLRMGNEGETEDYRRELNLETGIVTIRYRQGDAVFTREIFASGADQALVIRITCDKPGRINCAAVLRRERDAAIEITRPDRMVMRGQCDGGKGLRFAAALQVINQGGTLVPFDEGILAEEADAVTFLLAAGTNYRQPNGPEQDPLPRCQDSLNVATGKSYEELKAAHLQAYQEMFGRVHLSLGNSAGATLPTDERLAAFRAGAGDAGLFALFFQYGRYLLLSSSQPGGLPAHQQGIWNEKMSAPGTCDYRLDGALEMNYWGAETAQLPECHAPLFDLIDDLRRLGRRTANIQYGLTGFVAHNGSNPWGYASPGWEAKTGLFPTGAAWLSLHLWEHYLFTGDEDFLKIKAYPIMKEAAEFMTDFLVEDPKKGWLVTSPSTSPGTRFRAPNGQIASLGAGPALDEEIARELFLNCAEAAKILKRDKPLRKELESAAARLAPPQIGKKGQWQEWLLDAEPAEPGGNSLAPLFALYPASQFGVKTNAALSAAALKVLENLARNRNGSGWSPAWAAGCWARLGNGEKARESLESILKGPLAPNLFHLAFAEGGEPVRFQIEENLGSMAAVAEMLLQSQGGELAFLPALPKAWPEGQAKGLGARGGFAVDLKWKDGRIGEVSIASALGRDCRLRLTAEPKVTEGGKKVKLKKIGEGLFEFRTEEGRRYELRF